jgi:3-dehydroquinate dehydratase / shikimate dehydrogenase
MALVDMLNAAKQCDLLEVRLDRFERTPDIGTLLQHKPKPIIFSCRRKQEGGDWKGSEAERLMLLRNCIASKADYVEIELDVADQVRPFPPTKRVISYTDFQETPADIAAVYAEAQTKHADVIKLVTLARTPEEAWPLVKILAKPSLPTVAVGLGKPGIMLNVLGKKIGAPWAYAALERGMEAYPGQPTARDLNDVYHYAAIGRRTRLVGVAGFSGRDYAAVAALNAAFARLKLAVRCLPLAVGSVPLFRKVMDAVRLAGVLVDADHRGPILGIAGKLEPAAEESRTADLLLPKNKAWHAYDTVGRAAAAALEEALRPKGPPEAPLKGRMVMIVGTNAIARAVGFGLRRHGAVPIVAARERDDARQLAQALGCRHVQLEALYTTMHDVLVVCEPGELHVGYLRPGMVVADLSGPVTRTALLTEAGARGCAALEPAQILLEQLALQVHLLTGREAPRDVLGRALTAALENIA